MDAIYSMGLLGALILGGAGGLAAVARLRLVLAGRGAPSRLGSVCRGAGVGAAALGLLSAGVHRLHGHGPGSLEPMSVGAYLLFHRAYWLVLALALLALAGWRVADRGGRGRTARRLGADGPSRRGW